MCGASMRSWQNSAHRGAVRVQPAHGRAGPAAHPLMADRSTRRPPMAVALGPVLLALLPSAGLVTSGPGGGVGSRSGGGSGPGPGVQAGPQLAPGPSAQGVPRPTIDPPRQLGQPPPCYAGYVWYRLSHPAGLVAAPAAALLPAAGRNAEVWLNGSVSAAPGIWHAADAPFLHPATDRAAARPVAAMMAGPMNCWCCWPATRVIAAGWRRYGWATTPSCTTPGADAQLWQKGKALVSRW